jgi:hypothetical protein
MATALERLGHSEEAEAVLLECVAISHRLTEDEPDNAEYQADLRFARRRLGDIALRHDSFERAAVAYLEAALYLEDAIAHRPGDRALRRELADAKFGLFGAYAGQARSADAALAFVEGVQMLRLLVAEDPTDTDLASHLAARELQLSAALEEQETSATDDGQSRG